MLWSDRADALEQEACALLGVEALREWFRRTAGFFADHLKRYSKSRRQAPIYWPLSTVSGSYTLWLYYHRFNSDTLFQALDIAKEKLSFEERKLTSQRQEFGLSPTGGQRKLLAEQESFVEELQAFRHELNRLAPLWKPDLNDGVIINAAPLWCLFAHKPWQKSVKECWEALAAGDYDWAHLAMHLWPERVVPKCATDRSLAIAHGLDEVFWEKDTKDKSVSRKKPTRSIDEIVAERSSPAVKAALASLPNTSNEGTASRPKKARRKTA